MSERPCPFCKRPPIRIERLSHGWRFCNGCKRAFVLNEDGTAARWTETNHSPPPRFSNAPKLA